MSRAWRGMVLAALPFAHLCACLPALLADRSGFGMNDCCDDSAWLEQRIAAKKTLIVQYETALTTLAGGAQSYSLDTGQTRQVVTRANLTEIRNVIAQLESDISTLQQRLYGCGRFNARPGW